MLRRNEIRRLIEEHGAVGFLAILARLLGLTEEGRIPEDADGRPILEARVRLANGREIPRVRPEAFSLRTLWEAMAGPVEETLPWAQQRFGYVEHPMFSLAESDMGAVGMAAFPSAVGMLIATKVIEGYEGPGFIGDELVTRVPSSLRGERFVGFTSLQGPKVVGEGGEYEESTFGEKYVTTTETKRGRLLSITEELVVHDQTGQVLQRASNLGRKSREERERRIVRGCADVASTERVYRPSGTATQLYASGNSNLLAAATVLTDWTDVQEALAYHAKTQTDDREPDDTLGAQPIVWMPTHILVARELAGVAARIFAATITTAGNVEAPAQAILNAIGAGGLKPAVSPFLDQAEGEDQWDDASDWIVGDFPRAFVYKEIWPLQTFRAPVQNEAQFRRDILAQFKVREYGDINCVDHRLVLKVNAV